MVATRLSSMQSAFSMYPLPPSVWQNTNQEWIINRCLFLINLRNSRNEFFHGTDYQKGEDFYDFIKRKRKISFQSELNYLMTEYPEIYNEVWYERFFGD